MTARVALVDTNVVVSGLLTSSIDAPTSRILDSMLSGALRFALSVELLAEYNASPIFHQDYTDSEIITPDNIEQKLLRVTVGQGGAATTGRRPGTR